MLSDCLPGLRADRLAQLSSHIWRVYDINEDGQIDFYEFMTVLHVMSSGSSEDNLRQLFRVFDINSDGSISKDELERIVKDFQCYQELSNLIFYWVEDYHFHQML